MNLDQAKNTIQHILTNKFAEPTILEDINDIIPSEIVLYQNYPNPFNLVTKIEYSIPKTSKVELIVFDILGREVAKLADEHQKPGIYTVTFDGSQYSSGLYFFKLKAGKFNRTRKMLLMK